MGGPSGEADNLFLKSQRANPDTAQMMATPVLKASGNKWAKAILKRRAK